MAVNKQSFYESINHNTLFDIDFFKKVYAYSVCDDLFLNAVAAKLSSIGRREAVQAYNKWFAVWKAEDDLQMKKVAEWYHKECDKEFEKWQRKQRQQEEVVKEDWEEKKIQLLARKKQLLSLLKSTDN